MPQTSAQYDGEPQLFPRGLNIRVDIDGVEIVTSEDSPDSRTSIGRVNINPVMTYDDETNTLTLSDPGSSAGEPDNRNSPFRIEDGDLVIGGGQNAAFRITGPVKIRGDIVAGDIHHYPGAPSGTVINIPSGNGQPASDRRIQITTAGSTRVVAGRAAVLADQQLRGEQPAPQIPVSQAPSAQASRPESQGSWSISPYHPSVLSQQMYPKGEFFRFASGPGAENAVAETDNPSAIAGTTIDGHTLASLTHDVVSKYGFDLSRSNHFRDRAELVEAMAAWLEQPDESVFGNLTAYAADSRAYVGDKTAAERIEDGLISHGIIEVLSARDHDDGHVDALVGNPERPVDRRHLRALGLKRILREGPSQPELQQMSEAGLTERVMTEILEGVNKGQDALGVDRVDAAQLGLDEVFSRDDSTALPQEASSGPGTDEPGDARRQRIRDARDQARLDREPAGQPTNLANETDSGTPRNILLSTAADETHERPDPAIDATDQPLDGFSAF